MKALVKKKAGGTAASSSSAVVPRTSGKVDPVLVEKAVDALLKWSESQKNKVQLLEDDQLLYVVLGMRNIPDKSRTKPYRVTLPHPLYPLDGSNSVCLIVSDASHSNQKLGNQAAKERAAKMGLDITRIVPLSKLKKELGKESFSVEAKRKLCKKYDVFLAEDRILGELPKVLGKGFYKKKHPIPVTLTKGQWIGEIIAALKSTFVYVGGGTCSVIKAARASQRREEIIENVVAVMEGVAQEIPKKWANVRAYHLKSLESVALPLYPSLPRSSLPLKPNQGRLAEVNAKNDEEGDVIEDTVVAGISTNRKRKHEEGKHEVFGTRVATGA